MAENLLEQLQALLKRKKSNEYYADRLGISIEEVKELKEELRNNREEYTHGTIECIDYGEHVDGLPETVILGRDVNHGTCEETVTLQSVKPLSPKEIEELVGVDGINTCVERSWAKSHKNGTWTYSILIKSRKQTDFSLKEFTEFLDKYTPPEISVNARPCCKKNSRSTTLVDIELSLVDFHIDRLTLSKDSIESRKQEYSTIICNLVNSVSSVYTIRRLVFVIGNDFFNTDNYQGSTTNGTPQDSSVSWNKAYEEGFDLMVNNIIYLSNKCEELEIILIQGNHDRTKSYYMAHALEVFFRNTPNVSFDRDHSTTKFAVLGNTFIGYHHGNTKIDELPLLFATSKDSSLLFGVCKYREVHTGDKHFYMAKEIKGVRVQQLPSLVNPDRWSNDNNYVNNIRAGLALVYHPEKGKIAEFEERI